MTVKELIEELKKYPEDKGVFLYENERGCTFLINNVGENSYGEIVVSTDEYD